MSPEKNDVTFKVIDRRLFTSEGELRPEARETERAATASPPTPSTAPPRSPAPDLPPAAASSEPSRSFQSLVDFVFQNAAMLLGGYTDPRTGQAVLDLEGAREMIDMLDALREKSRGNLAPEDDQLLDDRLARLKLTYMEMTKAAAKAMREKATRTP